MDLKVAGSTSSDKIGLAAGVSDGSSEEPDRRADKTLLFLLIEESTGEGWLLLGDSGGGTAPDSIPTLSASLRKQSASDILASSWVESVSSS